MNKLMVLSLAMVLSTSVMADEIVETMNCVECVSDERKVQENNDSAVASEATVAEAVEVLVEAAVEAVERIEAESTVEATVRMNIEVSDVVEMVSVEVVTEEVAAQ